VVDRGVHWHNLVNTIEPKHDLQIIGSLRAAKPYPLLTAHTTRFKKKSFLPYAIANYQ